MSVTQPASQIPVTITVNVEVESHDVLSAGDAGLYGRYSYGRYGAREGIWRLLDVFQAEDVPATFFFDANDAERHPYLVEAAATAGHEVALLGTPDLADLPAGGLERRLDAERRMLAAVSGQSIDGWRAGAGILNEDTLPLLARLGFLYDSTFQDDDHPYCFGQDGVALIELPTFKYLTDTTFYNVRRTNQAVRKTWREELAAMHREGSYVCLTVNSRGDFGSGRAQRAAIVGDWIREARALPGHHVLTCRELAESVRSAGPKVEPFPFLEEFPQDGETR